LTLPGDTTDGLSSEASALILLAMGAPPGRRGLMSLLEANSGSPRGDP
jgi:hypothetical protein